MTSTELIKQLGFERDEKVAVFHMDDVGFCHASNEACFQCLDFGIASCGSCIVPSPWFMETAAICRENPQYDIGVELALTCEYQHYRWKAVSTSDPASGLLDAQGCLWPTRDAAIEHITSEAAEVELRMQLQLAFDHGIAVTHLVTHMGTARDPKFLPSVLALSEEFDIPLVSRDLFDHRMGDSRLGGTHVTSLDAYLDCFRRIEPGLTYFGFHPAKMSPELDAICGGKSTSAAWRNGSYEAFTNPRTKELIEELGIRIIGYRDVANAMRALRTSKEEDA